jgi:ferrous iron transport protein A
MNHLSGLPENAIAIIENFDLDMISSSQITELLELGFYPGAEILCLGSLPSLDKMLFLIGGTKVGLRISDCDHIQIKLKKE